jgi:hypothetical protein
MEQKCRSMPIWGVQHAGRLETSHLHVLLLVKPLWGAMAGFGANCPSGACWICLQSRNSVDHDGGLFRALHTWASRRQSPRWQLAHPQALSFFFHEDPGAVSPVPSGEGFVSRFTDGSGMDSCLLQQKISAPKLCDSILSLKLSDVFIVVEGKPQTRQPRDKQPCTNSLFFKEVG